MNKYYETGLWCGKYNCWCEDVTELMDNQNNCNGNCSECVFCEEVEV